MATFVQNGDEVRITIGTSIYDYNLREVDYTHNGTTITVETDGYTRPGKPPRSRKEGPVVPIPRPSSAGSPFPQ